MLHKGVLHPGVPVMCPHQGPISSSKGGRFPQGQKVALGVRQHWCKAVKSKARVFSSPARSMPLGRAFLFDISRIADIAKISSSAQCSCMWSVQGCRWWLLRTCGICTNLEPSEKLFPRRRRNSSSSFTRIVQTCKSFFSDNQSSVASAQQQESHVLGCSVAFEVIVPHGCGRKVQRLHAGRSLRFVKQGTTCLGHTFNDDN